MTNKLSTEGRRNYICYRFTSRMGCRHGGNVNNAQHSFTELKRTSSN